MSEDDWLTSQSTKLLLDWLVSNTPNTWNRRRKVYLWGVACCKNVGHLLIGGRNRHLVEFAERYAVGEVTANELYDARQQAEDAVTFASYAANASKSELSASVAIHRLLFDSVAGCVANAVNAAAGEASPKHFGKTYKEAAIRQERLQINLIYDVFGNPFRSVAADPRWLTDNVIDLARTIYDDRAFDRLPILADALMDAGCDEEQILAHCRAPGPHVRGCWVVDLILQKE